MFLVKVRVINSVVLKKIYKKKFSVLQLPFQEHIIMYFSQSILQQVNNLMGTITLHNKFLSVLQLACRKITIREYGDTFLRVLHDKPSL